MAARSGTENVNSGPHLRRRSPTPEYDPTKGACFNCGERVGVLEFALRHKGRDGEVRDAGHWRLCGPCWEWGNVRDPRDTDPLAA